MKRPLKLFLVISVWTMSCQGILEDYRGIRTLKVDKPNQDTIMVIENQKTPSSIQFSFKGKLSEETQVEWAYDSLLTHPVSYVLPKGTIDIEQERWDFYGRKVFIRYMPLKPYTSGNLDIKVRIQ